MRLNSISVDVEEYYHATNLEGVAPPSDWYRLPSRVVRATERTLDLFNRMSVKGTFFILGSVARRHPQLVKKIAGAGHEIASHGYSHRLAFSQTPKQFYRDVHRARLLLEDLSGEAVLGYRAPSFSIVADNVWAYQSLLQAGYEYDSSLFPIRHPRYGNASQSIRSREVRLESGTLRLYPLAVHAIHLPGAELRLPAAGGAYWRLLPRWYCASVLRARSMSLPEEGFHCYFHPWEIDAEQPVFTQLSFLTRFRHYGRTQTFERRLEYYLRSFPFAPLREAATIQPHGNNTHATVS